MSRQTLEVLAEFSNGRIIPRRIRYYDVDSAIYVEKNVSRLSYEVCSSGTTSYGVRFTDHEERILKFHPLAGSWQFSEHL